MSRSLAACDFPNALPTAPVAEVASRLLLCKKKIKPYVYMKIKIIL